MAQWLVQQRDAQITVTGMSELSELARSGRLEAGDLVQPPGSLEWMYAVEIPDLQETLERQAAYAETDEPSGGSTALKAVLGLVLLGIAGAGAWSAWQYSQLVPREDSLGVLDRLRFSELVVTTEGVQLLAEPSARAQVVGPAPKDSVLDLLAKRGDYYRARDKQTGLEGWVETKQVLPMYLLGGGKVMAQYDPLYNPDRYLKVQNASWMQLPEHQKTQTTVFQFMLQNESAYDMTDLVMVARIKDARGHDLEQVEFRVEGIVPAQQATMVGTMVDPTTKERRLVTQAWFDRMAAADPDMRLEYDDGIEVQMKTKDFTEATIDIVELRSVPTESVPGAAAAAAEAR